MTVVRYFAEEPCEHGRLAEIGHVEDGYDDRTMDYRPPEGKDHPNHWCPGGQRRELTGVLRIGVFPTFEGDHVIEIPGQRKKRLADELEPGPYVIIPLEDGS